MFKIVLGVMGLACVPIAHSNLPAEVAKRGMTSRMIMEQVVSGHLTELNGRYKLRLSESTYARGGMIGVHHHAGPGLRFVESGVLTYVQAGHTTIYRAGDCFYESGAVQHLARNEGKEPVRLLNFELLPADWKGASAYPVPDSIMP
ncbi:MAG TPA: cupin domain-containing protein [Gemmatimonadales bacterium]|nr:cupin domain-containing protein [Gemmatimonadales bacterium]